MPRVISCLTEKQSVTIKQSLSWSSLSTLCFFSQITNSSFSLTVFGWKCFFLLKTYKWKEWTSLSLSQMNCPFFGHPLLSVPFLFFLRFFTLGIFLCSKNHQRPLCECLMMHANANKTTDIAEYCSWTLREQIARGKHYLPASRENHF